MRSEIISKHDLKKFKFAQFDLAQPEDLEALDLEEKLPHKVAFKTTVQMSGVIGGDSIVTPVLIVKGKGTQHEILVIKGVPVARSLRTGQFGIVLCETWSDLIAIIVCPAFKQGKIIPMVEANDMDKNDIMNLASVNPGRPGQHQKQPLMKYFTLDDLDRISRLGDAELIAIHNAVMNVVNKVIPPKIEAPTFPKVPAGAEVTETAGEETKAAVIPLDTTTPEYRKQLLGELTNLSVAFAKNITTKAAMDLLMDNDPENPLLPQKTEEQLKAELLKPV